MNRFIIADIGQNFCGNISLACDLIDSAKENGADLVKFQLYDHQALYRDHPEIPDVSLTYDQAQSLFEYGRINGIDVFFSVFDMEKVDWCEQIGVKAYKVAKRCNQNRDLLERLTQIKKPVFISLGYRERLPDEWAFDEDHPHKAENFYELDCVGKYPTPFEDIDFNTWRDGISDHSIGIEAAKVILARSKIVEKHFAIDHKTGVDAPWSMTPGELRHIKDFASKVTYYRP